VHVSFEISGDEANRILKVWALKGFDVEEIIHNAKARGFFLVVYNNYSTGERVTYYENEEKTIVHWTLSIFH